MTPHIEYTAVAERRIEAVQWLRGFIDTLATEGMDAHRVEIAHWYLDRLAEKRLVEVRR